MRTCSICGDLKDDSEFYKTRCQCRACLRIRARRYNSLPINKARIREYNAEYQKQYQLDYRKQRYNRHQHRLKNDVSYRVAYILRHRLNSALKRAYKSGSAVRDLGCSIEFLKKYLESKFLPGMTWENHGKWHVDHIKPLSSFDLTNREELLKACNYTNLQPLWAEDNFRKGSKFTME